MVDSTKKSTTAIREIVYNCEHETVFLDSRLALYAENGRWLAISDLHYGYEISRRADGGLWPMWGRDSIKARVDELLNDYQPEKVILNGDIIDSSAAGNLDAIDWLHSVGKKCEKLILIEGNHDKGQVVRELDFVPYFQAGDFLFHHGHQPTPTTQPFNIEVIGHLHPSCRLGDGAGLSLKLPSLVQEQKRWIMPAFSPWAGGVKYSGPDPVTEWVCSPKRIFKV